ncbi:5-nitroimidazole antibiotic resistance protein [Byssothecium circinans]|uniref:5-nitroimidazole antibiotic resistance protein n=1 Tax=Byssothecium circinans TaxID=147558 RepID=A0A6A5U0U8_9PLEO|nr:5-nitroimidazole antibiotic resistance protein [Byssothecium circinans]
MAEYPKTSTNKLGRLSKRGAYDYATVHSIINTSPVLHVSFNDPSQPFPVVLPMLGCTGNHTNPAGDPNTTEQDLYIHGYVSGRIFKTSKETGDQGLPITVAATHIDGLVLALAPFHNSCNYRSAIIYGHATLLTDPDERLYAMTLITNNLLPERWEKSRNPATKAELDSTSILRVKVASASAKVRTGGPHDDRADLRDERLRKGVWTGTVPVWLQWGEPVPGVDNGREEVEGYIERWRVGENMRGKGYAYEAVQKDG